MTDWKRRTMINNNAVEVLKQQWAQKDEKLKLAREKRKKREQPRIDDAVKAEREKLIKEIDNHLISGTVIPGGDFSSWYVIPKSQWQAIKDGKV